MIRHIFITLLCLCLPTFAATFTDVTIEGTPYLTTNVLYEIYISALLREGDLYKEVDPVVSVNYMLTDPEAGDQIGRRFITGPGSRNINLLAAARDVVRLYYKEWLPSAITNAVPSLVSYPTINDFFAAAGLSSNGWRRAYSYDPATNDWRDVADPMYSYTTTSVLDTGEILGPWIIDDLQMALDHMRYRVDLDAWSGAQPSPDRGAYSGNSQVSWEDATTVGSYTTSTSLGSEPAKYSQGYIDPGVSPQRWYAEKLVYINAVVTPVVQTNSPLYLYGGSVAFAAYAKKANLLGYGSNQFDDYGTGLVETNHVVFDTQAILSTTYGAVTSAVLGDLTEPDGWCDEPAVSSASFRGYTTTLPYRISTINFPYTR